MRVSGVYVTAFVWISKQMRNVADRELTSDGTVIWNSAYYVKL